MKILYLWLEVAKRNERDTTRNFHQVWGLKGSPYETGFIKESSEMYVYVVLVMACIYEDLFVTTGITAFRSSDAKLKKKLSISSMDMSQW